MSWKLAPALETLRAQVNAAFPNRNRASDGTIGDASHAAQGRLSDHNPWVVLGGQAYVTALDITHDPAHGFDIDRFTDELLIACRDGGENRVKYAIANGLIMDTRPGFNPYTWRDSDGHFSHVHISVHSNHLLMDARNWTVPMLGGARPAPSPAPVPAPEPSPAVPAWPLPAGHYFGLITGPNESHGGASVDGGGIRGERDWVGRIQRALQVKGFAPGYQGWADGLYEAETVTAVKAFQRAIGYHQTGNVWPDDWARLLA